MSGCYHSDQTMIINIGRGNLRLKITLAFSLMIGRPGEYNWQHGRSYGKHFLMERSQNTHNSCFRFAETFQRYLEYYYVRYTAKDK